MESGKYLYIKFSKLMSKLIVLNVKPYIYILRKVHHAATARNATLERRERQQIRESHGESFDHESQKPSRSRRLTRRTRTSRRSNKETFTSTSEKEKKTPKGRWTRKGESEEPRREKREGEDAAPSGRMNGATSDVERGMLWRSRIARHCSEIDYRVYRERIREIRYRIMTTEL